MNEMNMDQTNSAPTSAEKPKRNKKQLLLIVGGLLLGVLIGYGLLMWLRPPSYNGVVIHSEMPVTNFTLTGPGGEPVSLIDFRGKVVLLYFGYTFCPDVCPATMNELTTAVHSLGRRADDVQVLMISVDPVRDTPEQLEEYLSYFDPSFIGLTGTDDELVNATAQMGIYFNRHEGTAESGYLVDHTATVMALDKQGKLRLMYPFGTTGEEIGEDLRYLVRE